MDLNNEAHQELIFGLLLEVRRYRNIYPQVILNCHHASNSEALKSNLGDVMNRWHEFEEEPTEELFQILFSYLLQIDAEFADQPLTQVIYDDGILLLGPCYFEAFCLVPGEYPFANMRAIELDAQDVENYRNTPAIQFKNQSSLKIVASQLTEEAKTQWAGVNNLTGKQYGLISTSIDNPAELTASIDATLTQAREQTADVVLFPELCIDEAGLSYIEKWIQSGLSDELYVPPIIVAGSFYHKVDGYEDRYQNRSTIYLLPQDASEPTVIHYNKRVPFSVKVPQPPYGTSSIETVYKDAHAAGATVVVEDLYSENMITMVNTSQGVIGFAICRDVLDLGGVGNPLEQYLDFVDHVMIISYNAGVTWLFEAQGEDLARWHNCSVSYINSRQALSDSVYKQDTNVVMGYSMYPWDRDASAINATLYFSDIYGKKQTDSMTYKMVPEDGIMTYTVQKTAKT